MPKPGLDFPPNAEIEHGQFGLAGCIAFLGGRSPFEIEAPNAAWARELHGFGWLRNLEAAHDDEGKQVACRLAAEWAIRYGAGRGIGARPEVAARRLISWLSHGNLLLDGADAESYEAITSSLARQLARLSSSWRDAPDGHPRLLALIALNFACLSLAGHERQLKDVEASLAAELSWQVLPDGGHISRNPGLLVELMLDLLPLSQCFTARGRTPPPQLVEALARILAMSALAFAAATLSPALSLTEPSALSNFASAATARSRRRCSALSTEALSTAGPRATLLDLVRVLGLDEDRDVSRACARTTEKHLGALGGYPSDLERPAPALLESVKTRLGVLGEGNYPRLSAWVAHVNVSDGQMPLGAIGAGLEGMFTRLVGTPYVLAGSRGAIREQLLRYREQLGLTYWTIPVEAMEPFAPIVDQLAGR